MESSFLRANQGIKTTLMDKDQQIKKFLRTCGYAFVLSTL